MMMKNFVKKNICYAAQTVRRMLVLAKELLLCLSMEFRRVAPESILTYLIIFFSFNSDGGFLERALRVPLTYVDESESGDEPTEEPPADDIVKVI